MGALVDQCPDCGKFVAKGSSVCPHCETELPERVEPAEPWPEPATGGGSSSGVARALGGAVVGATLAVIALTAGAGDVGALSDDPTAPRGDAAIVDDADRSTQPRQPQTPAAEAESSAQTKATSGLSAERRSRLASTIAAIRDQLARWPERYQIGHSDLADVQRRLTELERLIAEIPSPRGDIPRGKRKE